jgi:hypothetical protein
MKAIVGERLPSPSAIADMRDIRARMLSKAGRSSSGKLDGPSGHQVRRIGVAEAFLQVLAAVGQVGDGEKEFRSRIGQPIGILGYSTSTPIVAV